MLLLKIREKVSSAQFYHCLPMHWDASSASFSAIFLFYCKLFLPPSFFFRRRLSFSAALSFSGALFLFLPPSFFFCRHLPFSAAIFIFQPPSLFFCRRLPYSFLPPSFTFTNPFSFFCNFFFRWSTGSCFKCHKWTTFLMKIIGAD